MYIHTHNTQNFGCVCVWTLHVHIYPSIFLSIHLSIIYPSLTPPSIQPPSLLTVTMLSQNYLRIVVQGIDTKGEQQMQHAIPCDAMRHSGHTQRHTFFPRLPTNVPSFMQVHMRSCNPTASGGGSKPVNRSVCSVRFNTILICGIVCQPVIWFDLKRNIGWLSIRALLLRISCCGCRYGSA